MSGTVRSVLNVSLAVALVVAVAALVALDRPAVASPASGPAALTAQAQEEEGSGSESEPDPADVGEGSEPALEAEPEPKQAESDAGPSPEPEAPPETVSEETEAEPPVSEDEMGETPPVSDEAIPEEIDDGSPEEVVEPESGELDEGTPVTGELTEADAESDESVEAADTGTASITITSKNDQGQVLPGGCYNIWSNESGAFGTHFGSACDGEDNDGVSVLGGLMAGSFLVHTNWAPDGYIAGGSVPVELGDGEAKAIDVVLQAGGWTVSIQTKDGQGSALGGACYSIIADNSGVMGNALAFNCDGPQGGPYDGLTLIPGIPPGTYWLGQTTAPTGYALAPAIQFSVGTENVALGIVHSVASPYFVISTVDQSGALLMGACYSAGLVTTGIGRSGCDSDDGLDGKTVINGLAPGTYRVNQYANPPGYATITGAQQITLAASGPTHAEFVNAASGSVILYKTDEHGQPLPDSCFWLVDAATSEHLVFKCDVDDGANDGVLHFDAAAGTYFAGESYPPPGYLHTSSSEFSLGAGQTVDITVPNVPGGLLVNVETVDENGAPIPGVCYQLHWSEGGQPGAHVGGGCDWYDGANDGRLTLTAAGPREYVLVQIPTPFGYKPAANQIFTLQAGGFASLKVTNAKGNPDDWGRLVIRKVDPHDKLLPGACYALWTPDGQTKVTSEPHCDGGHNDPDGTANGIYTFPEVEGAFLVEEYKAPEGYVGGASQEVTVNPGEEKQLTFINHPKSHDKPDRHHEHPKPGTSHHTPKTTSDGGVGSVTKLPDTGTGPGAANSASLLAGLVSFAIVGFIAHSQRRKRFPV